MRTSTKTQTKINRYTQLTIHYEQPATNGSYADKKVKIGQIRKVIKKASIDTK
jgi:hypothetical protein